MESLQANSNLKDKRFHSYHFPTTSNHAIQDRFSETFLHHVMFYIESLIWTFCGIHICFCLIILYLSYQPLVSTFVLNHMHPNELQTLHRVYFHPKDNSTHVSDGKILLDKVPNNVFSSLLQRPGWNVPIIIFSKRFFPWK